MNTSTCTRWLLLFGAPWLLAACTPSKEAVCDDATKERARQFIGQVLEQEATGLRLREAASQGGRPVFYANVAYDRSEEPSAWDIIYIREGFRVDDASCAPSRPQTTEGPPPVLIDVRVQFAAGYFFDQETYGQVQAGVQIYTLRLQNDRFKISSRLPPPFVSTKVAVETVLGSEPYVAEPLLTFREQLNAALQRQYQKALKEQRASEN